MGKRGPTATNPLVYNAHDEKVGSVDDILVGKNGKLTAVLSVGGVPGRGQQAGPGALRRAEIRQHRQTSDNRVMLTHATKDSLQTMAEFRYRPLNG